MIKFIKQLLAKRACRKHEHAGDNMRVLKNTVVISCSHCGYTREVSHGKFLKAFSKTGKQ